MVFCCDKILKEQTEKNETRPHHLREGRDKGIKKGFETYLEVRTPRSRWS